MDIRRIEQAIGAYSTMVDKQDNARLEFFDQIFRVQASACADASGYALVRPPELKSLWNAKTSIFSVAPVNVQLDEYAQVLKSLGVVADRYKLDAASANFFERSDWAGILLASPLAQAGSTPAVYLEALQGVFFSYGMNEEQAKVARLLASLGLRTQIEAAAQRVARALDTTDVQSPASLACPVCGGLPTLASVSDSNSNQGGSKTLWCAQCGTQWHFQRIRCARCGTQNQQHLHLYHIAGDQGHRIASCESCGGYVRTVYAGMTGAPLSFEVEDVVMARLDALVQDPRFGPHICMGQ